jgi:hypothetical protein
MKKSWFESEDGRSELEAVKENPQALQVFFTACQEHLEGQQEVVMGCNIADPSKDREFIVSRAELEGARKLVRSIKQLLDKTERPRKKQTSKQE